MSLSLWRIKILLGSPLPATSCSQLSSLLSLPPSPPHPCPSRFQEAPDDPYYFIEQSGWEVAWSDCGLEKNFQTQDRVTEK